MPRNILCIAELAGSAIDDATWELLGAARSLAGDGGKVEAALLGADVGPLADALAAGFDAVRVFDDPRLEAPDGDARALALAPLVKREGYDVVLLAHTNTTIDLAPGLAVRAGRPIISDCLSLAWQDDGLEAVRTIYGGKVHARFRAAGADGYVATLRGGAFEAAAASGGAGAKTDEAVPDDVGGRRRTLRTVEPDAGEVDITAAEILVGVGRGIEDEENLEIVQALADALGAVVACSRPVVDKGWLPKARQIGTSGLTVKPRVYVAVGISGAFQHVGGIKGAPYIVAINKDAKAPIFGVADVGIVGDLFDVVPALEEAVREAKG